MSRQHVQLYFLRNEKLYTSKNKAIQALKEVMSENSQDGIIVLSRYKEKNANIKTLLGILYSDRDSKSITIFDSDCTITDNAKPKKSYLHYEELYKQK